MRVCTSCRTLGNAFRAAGSGGASLSVFGTDGYRACGPTGTFPQRSATCTLPAGPVTVVLNAAGTDAIYELTHQPLVTP